jgi:hypothetical protein
MPHPASPSPDRFDALLRRLPSDLDLDALARESRAIQRGRKLESGTDLLRLALARGPGGLSLSATAAWSGLLGLASMSDPAVKYRLDKAIAFLDAIVARQLAEKTAGPSIHWPGRVLHLGDSTCLREPGARQTSWRLHAVYDLGCGGFSHLELSDRHGAETINRGAPLAGEIRILDRGYARAPALHRFREDSGQAADYIVRVGWSAFALTDAASAEFDLFGWLRGLPPHASASDASPGEIEVLARLGPREGTLPIRLIAIRKSPEATEAARAKLRREASKRQKTLDPRSLEAAEFVILGTSLPREGYPAEEVLAAYRLRWQIELAFKRLKSLLGIDQMPTQTAPASRSWLAAHLIMALLCDEASQDFLAVSP